LLIEQLTAFNFAPAWPSCHFSFSFLREIVLGTDQGYPVENFPRAHAQSVAGPASSFARKQSALLPVVSAPSSLHSLSMCSNFWLNKKFRNSPAHPLSQKFRHESVVTPSLPTSFPPLPLFPASLPPSLPSPISHILLSFSTPIEMRPSSSYALPEPSSSSPSSSSPPPSSSSSAPPPPPPPPRPAPAIDLNAPSSSPKSREEASLLPTTRSSSDSSLRKSSGSEEEGGGGSRESRQVVFDGLPTLSLEQEGSDEVGGSRSIEAPFKSKGGPRMSVSLQDFFLPHSYLRRRKDLDLMRASTSSLLPLPSLSPVLFLLRLRISLWLLCP